MLLDIKTNASTLAQVQTSPIFKGVCDHSLCPDAVMEIFGPLQPLTSGLRQSSTTNFHLAFFYFLS